MVKRGKCNVCKNTHKARAMYCKGEDAYNNLMFSKLLKGITLSNLGNNNIWLWCIPCVLLAPYALYILLRYGVVYASAFYAGANNASYNV